MNNYLVLAFEQEESVAIGSSTWVQGNENLKKMDRVSTLFPKKLGAANVMARNHTPLILSLNATLEVAKILAISDDWTKIRKVLDKAEETSHLSSSLEPEVPKKKPRKTKVPERFQMSDSSDFSSPEPPPSRKIRAELNTEVQNELYNIIGENDSLTQMDTVDGDELNNNIQSQSILIRAPGLQMPIEQEGAGVPETQQESVLTQDTSIPLIISDPDIGRKLDIIMRQMSELKVHVEDIKRDIKKINDRNSTATATTTATANSSNLVLEGIFPIDSLNSLQEVNTKLEDEEFRGALNCTLAKFKGKDYRQTVGNVLKYLLSNELAANLAWSGTCEKAALKSFGNITAIIFDICNQPNSTQKDVLDIIKNWLRNSNKRRPSI